MGSKMLSSLFPFPFEVVNCGDLLSYVTSLMLVRARLFGGEPAVEAAAVSSEVDAMLLGEF
jgi:hypothetical protein